MELAVLRMTKIAIQMTPPAERPPLKQKLHLNIENVESII
jgi:hypothetical protein